jgi:hypothetical protein
LENFGGDVLQSREVKNIKKESRELKRGEKFKKGLKEKQ